MSTQPNEEAVTNAAAPKVISMPKRKKKRTYYIISQKDVIAACDLVRSKPNQRESWYARKLGLKTRTFVRLLHRLRLHKVNLDVPRLVKYKYADTKSDFVPPYERKVLSQPNVQFVPKAVPVHADKKAKVKAKASTKASVKTKLKSVHTAAQSNPVRLAMTIETPSSGSKMILELPFSDTKNLGKWLSEFAKTLSV